MKFTYNDQVAYAKLALSLLDNEKNNTMALDKIREFSELIKKHADENNWLIYDVTEYIYEQARLLKNEEGAFDDTEMRARIEQSIRDSQPQSDAIHEIVARIDQILLNENNDPIDQLGSYIVGATIIREDYEYYQDKYPILAVVADLGAQLETLKGSEIEQIVFEDLKNNFAHLKQQIAKQ